MTKFAYDLAPNIKPMLGLIVLQSDQTIETDFRRLFSAEAVELYFSRVPNDMEVSVETLGTMSEHLPRAAGLFPKPVKFDVVGYGCTSGTSVIGVGNIAKLVKSGCTTAQVTEPVSALVAACGHLGIKRLAFVSPYVETVSQTLRDTLAGHGIDTSRFGSFEEAEEEKVAHISEDSLFQAALQIGANEDVDAVFLSCTNLKTLGVIPRIEAALGKRVLSSNLVLAWHMSELSVLRAVQL